MSKRLRAFTIALVAVTLSLLALPAMAIEPIDDFIALPFTTYGDMLVDQEHGQVFVTGGNGGNEIAVVKLDGSGVTMVPDAPGASALSISQDGRYVYAALVNGDGIAQVDTATLSSRRFSTGPGSCPSQVAPIAGYVWFVANSNNCSAQSVIGRLDPVTGTVDPEIAKTGLDRPVLRAIPGTTKFLYAETGATWTDVGVYDVPDGVMRSTTAYSADLPDYLKDNVRLTNDGEHLMVSQSRSVNFYRTSDLSADGVTMLPSGSWPAVYVADDDVVATAQSGSSRVDVLRRVGGDLVNSVALGPTGAGAVKGLALVGDQLYAVTLGGTLRLYQVDRATVAPPDLTLDVPAQLPVGRPVTASGVLSDHGTPIAGAVVTVTQDGVDQPLASPTTDGDGRYSFDFLPQEVGPLGLTASYAGEGPVKPAATHKDVQVVKRQVTLTLAGPESVWPGESATLTGTLFDGDQAMTDVNLHFQRQCGDGSPADPAQTLVTGPGGTFSTTDTPGYCTHYDYDVWYDGDEERAPRVATTSVLVNWKQPSLDLQAPASVHVGEAVNLAGSIKNSDGPLAGVDLTVRVGTPAGYRDLGTVTTDSTGAFATSDIPSVAGYHCYQVTYAGDSVNRTARSQSCLGVVKWSTGLGLWGDSGSAELDEPVLLHGTLGADDGALGGVHLRVSRTDSFQGAVTLPDVLTGADGSFLIRDVPPNGGDVSYAVSYAGSDARAAVAKSLGIVVHRPAPTLELRTDRAVYGYGQTAQIDVDLTTDSLRTVQVYAEEAGRTRTTIFSGEVPTSGLTLQRVMTRNTKLSATIPEDGRALAASASVDTTTRAGLTTKALGSYRKSGGYFLYHPSADPRFATTLLPERRVACLTFELQRRYSSGWRTVSQSSCIAVGDKSTATWKLTGTQATRTPYRVRPRYSGDDLNVSNQGAWVYFKFV